MPQKRKVQAKKRRRPSTKPSLPKTEIAGLPSDVAAIRKELRAFLRSRDAQGRIVGALRYGIYAFYDYDGEPIYVGQTYEGLGARIGRHLTNQRTDAVAMNVLDPFEVAEVRVWPLDLDGLDPTERLLMLDRAEYTVFQKLLEESELHAVLNEKPPRRSAKVTLPLDYRKRIIPDEIYPHRKHPDIRIARRANTIASLARVISERKVSSGLRKALLTQAQRLERLAKERLQDFPRDAEADEE